MSKLTLERIKKFVDNLFNGRLVITRNLAQPHNLPTQPVGEIIPNELAQIYYDEYAFALLLNNLPPYSLPNQ